MAWLEHAGISSPDPNQDSYQLQTYTPIIKNPILYEWGFFNLKLLFDEKFRYTFPIHPILDVVDSGAYIHKSFHHNNH